MKIPEGRQWGGSHKVRGRRMHIVDWESTMDSGYPLSVCGMMLDFTYWDDDNWKLQELNPSPNPARPCPHCVKAVA